MPLAAYLVVLLALVLRLGLVQLIPTIPPQFDQSFYYREGKAILAGGFAQWTSDGRAPGYPLFLAANFALSGTTELPFVRIVQSLLSAATVGLLYGVAQSAFAGLGWRRDASALLSSAVAAVYPDYVFYSQTLWSETVAVFLAMAGIFLLLRLYSRGAQARWYLLPALVLGLAILTREVFLLMALVAPLWLVERHRKNPRRALLVSASFLVGLATLLSLSTARNWIFGNGLLPISWQSGSDFWKYNSSLSGRKAKFEQIDRVLASLPTGAAKNARGYREGLQAIAAHPSAWLATKLNGATAVWQNTRSLIGTAARLKVLPRPFTRQVDGIMQKAWIAIIVLTITGLIAHRDRVALFFIVYLIAVLALFVLLHYIVRFRLSFAIFFFPYAAFGLVALLDSAYALVSRQKIPDLRRAAVALTVIVLVVVNARWVW